MKFLITFKSSLLPVVPYEREATKAMKGVRMWLENPRVVQDYTIAGTRDSISIWEGDSIEQLHVDIMACPSHRLGDWEITPLLDNLAVEDWKGKLSDTSGVVEETLLSETMETMSVRGGTSPLSLAAVSLSAATCSDV